ncbi:MAG: hypothetical protein D6798_08895 [Deltaproteobacteria bacterium]|nr:MAG: hypothetical protein D6798_08895 [Deltaproteobacteria bacterium]
MSDLRSQLAAAFGQPAPEDPAAASAPSGAGPSILDDDAHLDTEWLTVLHRLRAELPGAPEMAARPKLAQARMVSDRVVKMLKKAGRKRDARQLAGLRDDFLARRDKAAWAAVKLRFQTLGLSARAYRSLKQVGADPQAVLARLDRTPEEDLRGMGAARLRELLG